MAIREDLIHAVALALSGDWEGAHMLVQKHANDQRANLIHAALHRQEGDNDNALYWYRRAGIEVWPEADLKSQLGKLRDELLQQP